MSSKAIPTEAAQPPYGVPAEARSKVRSAATGPGRSRVPPWRTRLWQLLWQVGFVVVLLAIWERAAKTADVPYLPPLGDIADGYVSLFHGELLTQELLPSLYRVATGFGIGVAVGISVGLLVGYLRAVEPWVRPVLEFNRAIPVAAVLPGALLLFGATDTMRVLVIAFGCTFPVLLAAIDGARRVDDLMLDSARIAGLSRPQTMVRVVFPAALPQILAGVRIALGIALIMMVISELIAADNGIGQYILRNQRLFRTADVYAGVLVIGTVGWVFTTAILQAEKRMLRWHRGWRSLPE
ncbi:MAG TPA: ABC transporter permease [Natronosporangium sp.]